MVLRLQDAVRESGLNPDTVIFDDPVEDQTSAQPDMAALMSMLQGMNTNICNNFDAKFGLLDKNLSHKFDEIEDKIETVEQKLDKKINQLAKELDQVRERKHRESSTIVGHAKKEMKPPHFDGQTSWTVYRKQFEMAALANEWNNEEKCMAITMSLRGQAAELLETVDLENDLDYAGIMNALETRFGNTHLQQLYRVQVANRKQQRGESLQQLHSDIRKLMHLAYPDCGGTIDVMTTDAFIRGMSDAKLQTAVRAAGKTSSTEALALALTLEAAEQASRSTHHVREIETVECCCEQANVAGQRPQREMRCWNCNRPGHLLRQCPEQRRYNGCPNCGINKDNLKVTNIKRNPFAGQPLQGQQPGNA